MTPLGAGSAVVGFTYAGGAFLVGVVASLTSAFAALQYGPASSSIGGIALYSSDARDSFKPATPTGIVKLVLITSAAVECSLAPSTMPV